MASEEIQSFPDAVRTMEGLRHVSYTPETALADLIDNSIAAGATKIGIRFQKQFDETFKVILADDGKGMDYETLKNAMKYGSSKELANSALSVYGLGMKMASTSFSKQFSVITRSLEGKAYFARYDLDEQHEKPWTFHIGDADKNQIKTLEFVNSGGSGTVVIWEKANFLFEERGRGKAKGPKSHKELEERIKTYLSMVFHRFMEGEIADSPQLQIFFNGEELRPWNPVNKDFLDPTWEPITNKWTIEIIDGEKTREVEYSITTYKLRAKDDPQVYEGAFLESRMGMKWQGIYAYRCGRILQSPDWLSTLTFHPDTNALRVCLELDPALDEVIRTDVRKANINLPDQMYEEIRNVLESYKQELKRRLREKKALEAKNKNVNHGPSNQIIDSNRDELLQADIKQLENGITEIKTEYGVNTTYIRQVDHESSISQRIAVVDHLEDGVFWEPRLNGSDQVIYINKSHPFYQKVYLASRHTPAAILGLDFLLYSLANAELMTRTDKAKEQFTQMRMLMSLSLRTLVSELKDDRTVDELDE